MTRITIYLLAWLLATVAVPLMMPSHPGWAGFVWTHQGLFLGNAAAALAAAALYLFVTRDA